MRTESPFPRLRAVYDGGGLLDSEATEALEDEEESRMRKGDEAFLESSNGMNGGLEELIDSNRTRAQRLLAQHGQQGEGGQTRLLVQTTYAGDFPWTEVELISRGDTLGVNLQRPLASSGWQVATVEGYRAWRVLPEFQEGTSLSSGRNEGLISMAGDIRRTQALLAILEGKLAQGSRGATAS
ncbi:MAG: hypothetical protein WC777_00205 [Candidatus Gracilibacteria bacterium]|jgi:hypothetical protein